MPVNNQMITDPATPSIRLSAPKPISAIDPATIPAPTATANSIRCHALPPQARRRARCSNRARSVGIGACWIGFSSMVATGKQRTEGQHGATESMRRGCAVAPPHASEACRRASRSGLGGDHAPSPSRRTPESSATSDAITWKAPRARSWCHAFGSRAIGRASGSAIRFPRGRSALATGPPTIVRGSSTGSAASARARERRRTAAAAPAR